MIDGVGPSMNPVGVILTFLLNRSGSGHQIGHTNCWCVIKRSSVTYDVMTTCKAGESYRWVRALQFSQSYFSLIYPHAIVSRFGTFVCPMWESPFQDFVIFKAADVRTNAFQIDGPFHPWKLSPCPQMRYRVFMQMISRAEISALGRVYIVHMSETSLVQSRWCDFFFFRFYQLKSQIESMYCDTFYRVRNNISRNWGHRYLPDKIHVLWCMLVSGYQYEGGHCYQSIFRVLTVDTNWEFFHDG